MQNRQELIFHKTLAKQFLLLAFGGNSVCWNMDFVVVLGILDVWGVKCTPLPVNEPLFSTA